MRTSTLTFAACLLALATGCAADPILGDWESERRLSNDEKNKLELYDDFTGDAEIWATPLSDPNAWYRFEFEVSWWREEGTGQYGFDLNCTEGPCSGDDFDMDCELIEVDGDEGPLQKLDCEGEKKWENYPLQWQRD